MADISTVSHRPQPTKSSQSKSQNPPRLIAALLSSAWAHFHRCWAHCKPCPSSPMRSFLPAFLALGGRSCPLGSISIPFGILAPGQCLNMESRGEKKHGTYLMCQSHPIENQWSTFNRFQVKNLNAETAKKSQPSSHPSLESVDQLCETAIVRKAAPLCHAGDKNDTHTTEACCRSCRAD